MFFSRSKVLTGLVTFSMAAAVMGAPVKAMGYSARLDAAADLNPITGNVITPENAQAELVADAVLSIVGPGQKMRVKKDSGEKKAIIDAATEKNSLKQDEKIELAVAAPNVYLNIHTDASLGSEVIGKLYSNDVAKILQDNGGDWVKIKSGSLVGYVLGEYLVKGDEAALLSELVKKNVAVVDNSENEVKVHKNKSEKNVIMTVSQGEQIEVRENMEEEDDGWIEVSTENGKGYVKMEDVSVTDSYPVAETAEEQQERMENATVKDIADDAQKKADKASEVAQAAAQKAEEAASVFEDEDVEPTKAEEKAAETAQAVAEKAQTAADNMQVTADTAKEEMLNHGAETGQAVADFALQFVGNPYVWGGSSLTHGTDCSGFTMAVYSNFGVGLPHYDASQRGYGIGIDSLSDARPGDLICFYGHVGIYIGDGMMVHASNARDGIKISKADYRPIAAIRRIFY
jgi:cell wall-associated NlpC family hydrolase